MMNNTELLKLAEKYLGTTGSEPRAYCGLGSGQPWCCAFVTYIFAKGDDKSLFYGGSKVVYCPTAITWCYANLAQIPLYLAMPSDIIFFDWNANNVPDHIGFVRSRVSDQQIKTIEGNTAGSKVAYQTRAEKYVLGVFRPKFKPASIDVSKPVKVDGKFDYNSIALMQLALGRKATGILTKDDVKALQKKVGVAEDGAWGKKTSKAVQKKLCGFKGDAIDGWFGVNSVIAFQKWINATVKFEAPYSGEYPNTKVMGTTDHAGDINRKALEFAFPYGTAKSKYTYPKAKPIAVCKAAIAKVWDTTSWSGQMKNGADCAVFVGSVVGILGIDKFSQKCKTAISQIRKSDKWEKVEGTNTKAMKAGTVGCWTKEKQQHIFIVVEKDGVKYIAEANHPSKYYGRLSKKAPKYTASKYKTISFHIPKETTFVVRTYLTKGDKGDEVKKLQKYLNWFYQKEYKGDVVAESGVFDKNTLQFVKLMQADLKVPADGKVGAETVKAMKAVKK